MSAAWKERCEIFWIKLKVFKYVVVKGVPEDTFEQLGSDRCSILYSCRLLYLDGRKRLRVTMPISRGHDYAVTEFDKLIMKNSWR
jgi:hypothetical protein